MTSKKNHKKAHPALGLLCIALVLYPISIGLGIIKTSQSDVNGTLWLIFLCGMVFVIGGIMILVGRKSRYNNLLAAVIFICFTILGIWVSLFASSQGMSGGIPLLSKSTNVTIGRWLFGFGALICFLMFIYALRSFFKRKS